MSHLGATNQPSTPFQIKCHNVKVVTAVVGQEHIPAWLRSTEDCELALSNRKSCNYIKDTTCMQEILSTTRPCIPPFVTYSDLGLGSQF